MALRWGGDTGGTNYSACYTSWGKATDVVTTNTSVNGSALYTVLYPTTYSYASIVDGISDCGYLPLYLSLNASFPYVIITLKTYTKVTAVNIVNAYYAYFQNIYVYFGNSTKYSSNAVIGRNISNTFSYSDFEISLSLPITGMYLTIVSQAFNYLEFTEVMIIEYTN